MKIKFPIVVLLIVVGVFLFYWFQWRPVKIKHDCSWVHQHSDAIPSQPAMTEEDLTTKGMISVCPTVTPSADIQTVSHPGIIAPLEVPDFCGQHNQKIIDDYSKSRPAVPAKDWYEKATDTEYKFCLHDKGL